MTTIDDAQIMVGASNTITAPLVLFSAVLAIELFVMVTMLLPGKIPTSLRMELLVVRW